MMRKRWIRLVFAFVTILASPLLLAAQSAAPKSKQAQASSRIPELSGIWTPRPDGIPISTWDSSDPFGKKPELAPMAPWAAAKWKEARPPFGAKQTFQDINDPVQRYCDPPGLTRIYMYPYEFTIIQTPQMVYFLYDFTRVFRTIGFNDKTWLDHTGHPHSEALHVVERLRRVDPKTMELTVSVEDPKAYTKSFSGKKYFEATTSPMGEAICVYSEMDAFQKGVID